MEKNIVRVFDNNGVLMWQQPSQPLNLEGLIIDGACDLSEINRKIWA